MDAEVDSYNLPPYEKWRASDFTGLMRLPNGKIIRPKITKFLLSRESFFLSFIIGTIIVLIFQDDPYGDLLNSILALVLILILGYVRRGLVSSTLSLDTFSLSFIIGIIIVLVFLDDPYSSLLNSILTLALILGYIGTGLVFSISKIIFPKAWFIIMGMLIGFFLYGFLIYFLMSMIGWFYIFQLVPYLEGFEFFEQIALVYDIRQNQNLNILGDIAQIFDGNQWFIQILVLIYLWMPAFSISSILNYKAASDVYWQSSNIVYTIIVFFVKRAFINLAQGVLLGVVANLLFNIDILLGVVLGILWFTNQFIFYLWTWRRYLAQHFEDKVILW